MFGHVGDMASITEYDDEFPLLETEGLYAARTSGAGDCLFNSLSDQLYGHENAHLEIRSRVVEHLRQNPENFMSFIEVRPPRLRRGAKALSEADLAAHTAAEIERAYNDRLARMGKTGTYGDNLEIQAFVNEYDTCVRIFQREFSYFIRPTGNRAQGEYDQADRPVLYIAHHAWEHYSSIRNRDGPHTGLPNVCPQPTTPRTIEAAEERLAASTPFQPWMENAVSTALPYTESSDVIKGTLRHFNYDVNEATLHLIAKWEDESGLNADVQDPEPVSQPESRPEAVPDIITPLDLAEIVVKQDILSASTPETSAIDGLPLTPSSSIIVEEANNPELLASGEDDEPRAKRRKSPEGVAIPVAPIPGKDAPDCNTTDNPKAKRAARKTTKTKAVLAQPTRRSARLQAKAENQTTRTTSIYAATSSSDEESDSESSSGSSECTVFAKEPPRSRKQRRQDAKAAATSKQKPTSAKPATDRRTSSGGRGMHTVTSGIRELYV